MSSYRIPTPSSAKTRRSKTPSAKRCPSAVAKRSLLFAGQEALQLETLNNFRELISNRIKQEISHMIWVKILLVGPAVSGKTSLIRLLCEGKYFSSYQPTTGVDYGFKLHQCTSETTGPLNIRVNFWDTAGGAEYFQVRNELYTETDVCILVTDVSMNPKDQINILRTYRNEVDKYSRKPKNGKYHLTEAECDEEFLDEDIELAQAKEMEKLHKQKRAFTLAVCANKCDLLVCYFCLIYFNEICKYIQNIGRNEEDPSLIQIKEFAEEQNLPLYKTSCTSNNNFAVEEMFSELIEQAAVKKLQKAKSEEFLSRGQIEMEIPVP